MITLTNSLTELFLILLSLILIWFEVSLSSSIQVVVNDLSPYNVIGNFTTRTFTECRMKCNEMIKCNTTSVVDEWEGSKRCLLLSAKVKNTTECKASQRKPTTSPQPVQEGECVTGKAYGGETLPPKVDTTDDWQKCRENCKKNDKCVVWSWRQEDQRCFLKALKTDLKENEGIYVSGTKNCKDFSIDS